MSHNENTIPFRGFRSGLIGALCVGGLMLSPTLIQAADSMPNPDQPLPAKESEDGKTPTDQQTDTPPSLSDSKPGTRGSSTDNTAMTDKQRQSARDAAQRSDATQPADATQRGDASQRADATQRGDASQRADATQRGDASQRADATQRGDASQRADSSRGDASLRGNETRTAYTGPERSGEALQKAAERRFRRDATYDTSKVDLKVKGNTVTLTGEVPSLQDKRDAEIIVGHVAGVHQVDNQLKVRKASFDDAELQRRIEEDLGRDGYSVKVEHHKVQLTGEAEDRMRRDQIERQIAGMQGVQNVDNQVTYRDANKNKGDALAKNVTAEFDNDRYLSDRNFDVQTQGDTVVLKGTVPTYRDRVAAERLAYRAGAQKVDSSGLQVGTPINNKPERNAKTPADGDPAISQRAGERGQTMDGKTPAKGATAVNGQQRSLEQRVHDCCARISGIQTDNVSVEDGVVKIDGTADSLAAKRRLANSLAQLDGVEKTELNIEVNRSGDKASSGDQLQQRIDRRMKYDAQLSEQKITSKVNSDGVVVLTGEVDNWRSRQRAEDRISELRGVREIENNITITGKDGYRGAYVRDTHLIYSDRPERLQDNAQRGQNKDTTQRDRTSDTAMSTTGDKELMESVQSELWWSPFVDSARVQVSVQNGVVTLNGTVEDADEQQAAIKNAYEAGAERVTSNLKIDPSID